MAVDALTSQFRFHAKILRKLENPGRFEGQNKYFSPLRENLDFSQFWTDDIEGGFGLADNAEKL